MSSSNLVVLENNNPHVPSDTQKAISIEKINNKTNSHNSKTFENKIITETPIRQGRWTDQEHRNFIKGILKTGKNNWKKLEKEIPTRTSTQIRSHAQKFLVKLLKKYNILNHKRSAFVTKELLLRNDIDIKDKYIIKVLNNYRRKINSLVLKSDNSIENNKLYDSFCNKRDNDNLNHNLKKNNTDKNPLYINLYSQNNINIYSNLLIKRDLICNKNSIIKTIDNLLTMNSQHMSNLYELRNQYDINSIKNHIKKLIFDFESS